MKAEMGKGTKRYSPLFLVAFTALLISTFFCIAGALAGILSAKPEHHDTLWFWASGHFLVHGQNPYDREAIRQIETSLGLQLTDSVPMTLNPPYTLFLMAPLGLLGPRLGILAWSFLLALCWIASVWALRSVVTHSYERGYQIGRAHV